MLLSCKNKSEQNDHTVILEARISLFILFSFYCEAIKPPVTAPLFLQVVVGKREYSGSIGQDGFSFPVTSLRDSTVMMLRNADEELISKTEVKTKEIVELGTMDVVFTLDSGGKIIIQLQFLLSAEDRKRVQEMRNFAMKRKQQELLGNGLYFQDSQLSKEQTEKISDIPSKGDQLTLWKSLLLDDLKESAVFSEIRVDSRMKASKDLLLPSVGSTSKLEGPIIGSKKGHGEPESRASSAVKKMISAFESSPPQSLPSITRIKSESSLEVMSVSSETGTTSDKPSTPGAPANSSDRTQTGLVAETSGKVTLRSGDKDSSSRSGRQVMFGNKKSNASRQINLSNTYESRRRSSSRRDEPAKKSMGEADLIRSKKRSEDKHRRSIGPYSPEQTNSLVATSSITWIHPHVCITTASRQLKDLVELERLDPMKYVEQNVQEDTDECTSIDEVRHVADSAQRSGGFPVLNGWMINQGVRVVIVIIACGAVFLNNR